MSRNLDIEKQVNDIMTNGIKRVYVDTLGAVPMLFDAWWQGSQNAALFLWCSFSLSTRRLSPENTLRLSC